MRLTRSQQFMIEDGFPSSLFRTAEQRAAWWAANPPKSMPLFRLEVQNMDEETEAFRAQIEEERKAKARAQIGRMKNRFASKAIDHSKMRWDQRRNKFVEDTHVSAPDQRLSRPVHLSNQEQPATEISSTSAEELQTIQAADVVSSTGGGVEWSHINKGNARALAELNGVWDDKYAKLSGGLLVMTVVNRLKGIVKRGGEVKWQ